MSTHAWKFQRQSGFDQVVLRTADDIRAIADLDQKLWVALASPAKGLELDGRTLALLDADGDGRIRAPEVIGAIRWLDKVLKDLGGLSARAAALPLSALREDTPEGQLVLKAARRILNDLGQSSASEVSPAHTADTQKIFAETLFNGDGIVTPAAAEGGAAGATIEAIVACMGGETDRSGKPGVSAAKVEAFYGELAAYAAWRGAAEADPAGVVPLGDATEAAAAAFAAVRGKVEDWFTRCRLAAFDARAGEHLARPAAEWAGMADRSLSAGDDAIAAFPLARIEPGKALSLTDGINPAWADKLAAFKKAVVVPLLGERSILTAEQWEDLKRRFAGHEAWLAARKGAAVEGLGLDKVRALLAGDDKAAILALIAQDEARRPEAEALASVDKAALLYRDFYTFLNNFVSFADFYDRGRPAIFQAGTLYLDGRTCDLCLSVADVGKHSAVAGLSHAYLAYCECTRKGSAEKRTIAVAFTGGDVDFLRPGRNGLFYDRDGVDWDATIVKVVEAPLSLRQAFWSPYKRVGRLITDQIEKFAAAREKQVEASSTASVGGAAGKVEAGRRRSRPRSPPSTSRSSPASSRPSASPSGPSAPWRRRSCRAS
ncbi:MAG: hypothetical protein R3F43_14700 [bacterium]